MTAEDRRAIHVDEFLPHARPCGGPPRPAGAATGTNSVTTVVTWTRHPEGRGTRLFVEHRGCDPDDPAQQLARTILGGGWRGTSFRAIRAVLADRYT